MSDRDGRWSVKGARPDQKVWRSYSDFPGFNSEDLDPDWLSAAMQHVAAVTTVEQCEAPLEPGLAVRFTDEVNERLALVRPGVVAMQRPDELFLTMDGQTYWFGGVAFGQTHNGRQGPDIDTLRRAADMMIAYCFANDPASLDRLEDAVAELEDSEPG